MGVNEQSQKGQRTEDFSGPLLYRHDISAIFPMFHLKRMLKIVPLFADHGSRNIDILSFLVAVHLAAFLLLSLRVLKIYFPMNHSKNSQGRKSVEEVEFVRSSCYVYM